MLGLGKFVCLYIALFVIGVQADTISVVVGNDVLSDFKAFTRGRQVSGVVDYASIPPKRQVVELVLLIQALRKGNYEGELRIQNSLDYSDLLTSLATGETVLSGESVWRSDAIAFGDSLWVSDPVLRRGESTVGIYTCKGSIDIKKATDLRRYKAVMVANTDSVFATLLSLGVRRRVIVDSWESLVEKLCAGGADFALAEFPHGPKLVIEEGKHRLSPVSGVKVRLHGTRHYAVSRQHPKGRLAFFALQRGLRKLRVQGAITKAYRQSGTVNNKISDWVLLNP